MDGVGVGGVPRRVPSILPIPAGYKSRETLNTVLRGVTAVSKKVTGRERQRRQQRVGSSTRGSKTNCTFYILHYRLCTS